MFFLTPTRYYNINSSRKIQHIDKINRSANVLIDRITLKLRQYAGIHKFFFYIKNKVSTVLSLTRIDWNEVNVYVYIGLSLKK